jgi:hypothetical protein
MPLLPALPTPPVLRPYLCPQFVYLKEAFSPSPEERIAALHTAFAVDGRLVVNYALTPAWG